MVQTLTKIKFAEQCGCPRGTVTKWVQAGKLELCGDEINVETPWARDTLKRYDRKKLENEKKAYKARQDKSERKSELELEKVKQQGLNLDLKNRQLRAKLRDARTQDAAFASLLQAAWDEMKSAALASIRPIITAAIANGHDSYAESESTMLTEIGLAAEDTRKQWDSLVSSWESTAVIMGNADKLADS